MKRIWTASMVLAVVMVLLSGTVAGRASALTPATQPDGAATTKTARVRSLDLIIEYPATWTVVDLDATANARTRRLLAKKNPKLAEAFDDAPAMR